jgi:hypothetical protein
MKKTGESKVESPKKLVLRRSRIRELDSVDLSLAACGMDIPKPPPPGTDPTLSRDC